MLLIYGTFNWRINFILSVVILSVRLRSFSLANVCHYVICHVTFTIWNMWAADSINLKPFFTRLMQNLVHSFAFIWCHFISLFSFVFICFHLFSFGYIHSHLFSLVFIHFKLKITHSFTFLIGFNHRITDSYSITCTMLTHCEDITKLV